MDEGRANNRPSSHTIFPNAPPIVWVFDSARCSSGSCSTTTSIIWPECGKLRLPVLRRAQTEPSRNAFLDCCYVNALYLPLDRAFLFPRIRLQILIADKSNPSAVW